MTVDASEIPDFTAERDRRLDAVFGFIEALRRAGVQVTANAGIDALRALSEVGFDDREQARAALRATLVTREEDLARFDRLFPAFWARLAGEDDGVGPDEEHSFPEDHSPYGSEHPDPGRSDDDESGRTVGDNECKPNDADIEEVAERLLAVAGTEGTDGPDDEDTVATETAVYSPTGARERVVVGHVDDELTVAVDRLGDAIAGLRGRRWTSRGDRSVAPRRTLRRSFATGGIVLSVPTRDRKRPAVRAVFLVDVSRSVLDVIDRQFVIGFLQRAHKSWRDIRSFFFDTSIREVSDVFAAGSSRETLEALERAENEWGGGTRIGHTIDSFRRNYPHAVERDTVVFVVSDGLEVGEVELLEERMAWLNRRSRAVLWLNPLAASRGYEPTCRGMEASLPYIDGLFSLTSPEDLLEVARQVEQRGIHGQIGYEYDFRMLPSGR